MFDTSPPRAIIRLYTGRLLLPFRTLAKRRNFRMVASTLPNSMIADMQL